MALSLTVDQDSLVEACARYGILELSVFGSVVRGQATQASDIDFLYVLKPGARLGWGINDLVDELSQLLGRPVDLVSKNALHSRLAEIVLAQAQVLYAA
jgi:predicted nucleotidyltransferase